MKVARWDPFKEFALASERLDRTTNPSYSDRIENSFGPWLPPIDILERQDLPVIRAEVVVPKADTPKPKPIEIKAA